MEVSADVLDRARALDLVGGDEELLQEIAKLFLDDYPNSLADIRSAAQAGDARKLEHAAHGLKGSVSNFAADGATQAAFMLEKMGRTGDLASLTMALQQLEHEFQLLHPALVELAA